MKNRHVVNGSCTIDNRDIQCMNVRHNIVHASCELNIVSIQVQPDPRTPQRLVLSG